MHEYDVPIEERQVTSFDGTRITYFKAGTGPGLWVIPPAMGAPRITLKFLLEAFQHTHTLISWDMRGFYRSRPLGDARAVGVEANVRDLEAIVAAEQLPPFVLGGWSMGVQISLEYYHRHPEEVRALVLINGPYEHMLQSALSLPGAERFFTNLLQVGHYVAPLLNHVIPVVFTRPGMPRLLQALGLLAANPVFFKKVLRDFSRLDWPLYLRVIEGLHEHSAAPYLSEVVVPTLITAGTRDRMTPMSLAIKMHHLIAGSELWLVSGGTHYTPQEYPEILAQGIERFLRRVEPAVFPPAHGATA